MSVNCTMKKAMIFLFVMNGSMQAMDENKQGLPESGTAGGMRQSVVDSAQEGLRDSQNNEADQRDRDFQLLAPQASGILAQGNLQESQRKLRDAQRLEDIMRPHQLKRAKAMRQALIDSAHRNVQNACTAGEQRRIMVDRDDALGLLDQMEEQIDENW